MAANFVYSFESTIMEEYYGLPGNIHIMADKQPFRRWKSMDEIKTIKNEKPIVVSFTTTNEINMKQAVRMIIESHGTEEPPVEYEDYREAL